MMSNPSFEGLLKIGKSDRDPTEFRAEELYSTGVPQPFNVEWYGFVNDHHSIEKKVHSHLGQNRENKSREFFRVSIDDAVRSIKKVAQDDLVFERSFFSSKTQNQENREKIPVGDKIFKYRKKGYTPKLRLTNAKSKVPDDDYGLHYIVQRFDKNFSQTGNIGIVEFEHFFFYVQWWVDQENYFLECTGPTFLCIEDQNQRDLITKYLSALEWTKPSTDNPNYSLQYDRKSFLTETPSLVRRTFHCILEATEHEGRDVFCIYDFIT